MSGDRQTKTVAKRIDLAYHKQPAPLRTMRRLLVILCGLAAVAWGGWSLLAKSERLYNPGPVSASHAMFENDCAQCHSGGNGGNGSGKFMKSVSDNACLKCHDAAIHAPTQTTLVSTANGKPNMSSNCTSCHMEHKGHEMLAGASDMLCTRCHDNLSANTAGGKTPIQNTVTTFNQAPAHPTFGRVLKQGGEKWTDNTPLKFNHKKHLSEIKDAITDCTTCHRPSPTGDRRTMAPLSYEANCKSCHPMSLAANLPEVPHQSFDLVRLFTSTASTSFAQKLAAMTPEEKEKLLTTTTTKRVGLRNVTETKKITEQEWLDLQLKPLVEKIPDNPAVSKLPSFAAVNALEGQAKTAALLELSAAYGISTSCNFCHTLQGNPAATSKSSSELLHTLPTGFNKPVPTTAPTTAPVTVPQYTDEGRRWFTASIFSHDAHRSRSCLECHAQTPLSTLTSDVLLPDLQSCTTCHHPGGPKSSAASNNCITCHIYHDRTKESPQFKGHSIAKMK